MPKFLIRIISLLLIAGLLIDPALASAFSNSSQPSKLSFVFAAQAFAPHPESIPQPGHKTFVTIAVVGLALAALAISHSGSSVVAAVQPHWIRASLLVSFFVAGVFGRDGHKNMDARPTPQLLIPSERERVLSALRAAPLNVIIPKEKWIPTVYLEDVLQSLQQIRDPRMVEGLTLRMPYWLNAIIFTAGLAGFVTPRFNSLSVTPFPLRRLFQRFFTHELGHIVMFNLKRLHPEAWRKFENRSWTPYADLRSTDKFLSAVTFAGALVFAIRYILLIVGGNLDLGPWASLGFAALLLSGGLLFSSGGGLVRQWSAKGEEFSKASFDPTKLWSFLTAYSLANADEEAAELISAAFTQPEALNDKAVHNEELDAKLAFLEQHIFVDGYFTEGRAVPLQAPWWSLGWPGPRLLVALFHGLAVIVLFWEPAAEIMDFPMRLIMVLSVPILFTILQGPSLGLRIHLQKLSDLLPETVKRGIKRAVSAPVRAGFEFMRLTMLGNLILVLLFIRDPENIHFRKPVWPSSPPWAEFYFPKTLHWPQFSAAATHSSSEGKSRFFHPLASLRQSAREAISTLNEATNINPASPQSPQTVQLVAPPRNGPFPALPPALVEIPATLPWVGASSLSQFASLGVNVSLLGRHNGTRINAEFTTERMDLDQIELDKIILPLKNPMGGQIQLVAHVVHDDHDHSESDEILASHTIQTSDREMVVLTPWKQLHWKSVYFRVLIFELPKEDFKPNQAPYSIPEFRYVYHHVPPPAPAKPGPKPGKAPKSKKGLGILLNPSLFDRHQTILSDA